MCNPKNAGANRGVLVCVSEFPYRPFHAFLSDYSRQELIRQVIDGLTSEQEDQTGVKVAAQMSFYFEKRVTNHENKDVFDRAMQLTAEKIKVRTQDIFL